MTKNERYDPTRCTCERWPFEGVGSIGGRGLAEDIRDGAIREIDPDCPELEKKDHPRP